MRICLEYFIRAPPSNSELTTFASSLFFKKRKISFICIRNAALNVMYSYLDPAPYRWK